MRVTYYAKIEPDGDNSWVVSFRDIPQALTGARTEAQARIEAVDCLKTALTFYSGKTLPTPSAPEEGEFAVEVYYDSTENHRPGVEVRPGVWTTADPKFDWDHNLKRMVNSGHGRPIPDDVGAFTLLMHDNRSAGAIEHYAVSLFKDTYNIDLDHAIAVFVQLKKFKLFANFNSARMKDARTLPRIR